MTHYQIETKISLLLLCIIGLHDSHARAQQRVWKSANGKFKVKAELVDYSEDEIRLEKSSGKIISVPLEKICNSDRKFLGRNPLCIFRLEGIIRVSNSGTGFGWLVFARQEVEGLRYITLQSGSDPLKGFAQIVIQPLTKRSISKNKKQQFVIGSSYAATTWTGYSKHGIRISGKTSPEFRDGEVTQQGIHSAKMHRQDGAVFECRLQSIFGNSWIYHVTVFAPTKEKADKFIKFSPTIKDLG